MTKNLFGGKIIVQVTRILVRNENRNTNMNTTSCNCLFPFRTSNFLSEMRLPLSHFHISHCHEVFKCQRMTAVGF